MRGDRRHRICLAFVLYYFDYDYLKIDLRFVCASQIDSLPNQPNRPNEQPFQ